jgi:uncharacterized membrane protein
MNIVTETHARTLTKTVLYRSIVVLVMMAMVLAYGGSPIQALQYGLATIIIGTSVYYVYERLCLFVPWARDAEGKDSMLRSVIKTVFYRLIIIGVVMVVSRLIFLESNASAAGFALVQTVINLVVYFIVERVFNRVNWGKKLPDPIVA